MKTDKSRPDVPSEAGKPEFSDKEKFPIVGIGASAGGLEALEQFFHNVPGNTGMAFVVIQHLDPNHVGIMPELLQRITNMKVIQVTERLIVKPNHLYVIPPNKSMQLLNGILHLFDPSLSQGIRLPIDTFFHSLADDMHYKSIGIVLSGMGSDGSLGVRAIKEQKGIVLVQDPETAKFDGMPRSAIHAVDVDAVAPADELPDRLLSILQLNEGVKPNSTLDLAAQSNLEKIIILLRQHSGHDFSDYKKNTLFRRIERRKGIHHLDKINQYLRFLQENPSELTILFKELLIGVTSFFRDPSVWLALRENVIPALIAELPDNCELRAWIPGCSTGEEAYSLAIVFKEILEKTDRNRNISLQIFATDIDADAIEKARKGIFPKNIETEMSAERLKRFFTREHENYRVVNSVREMVVFAAQNVIKDPPFTRVDILLCRNLLIYMEPELQKKLIILFNYSINPGGILLLGTSESIDKQSDKFTAIDDRLKIFKRSTIALSPELVDFPSAFYHTREFKKESHIVPKIVDNIQALTDQIILQRFAPPSVLINDKGDIIYISGRTGKYLEPVAGKANWNIYAMAREGLRHVLPGAIRRAILDVDTVILNDIKVGTNGGTQFVDITIVRLVKPEPIKGLIMVVFNDLKTPTEHFTTLGGPLKRKTIYHYTALESELQRSYEELQSTREEMQISQEVLKTLNEELQSTNEELQSTNEELTTSKEEMQSMNEELQTVNIELQSKVSDFARSNDDMQNLLNSSEIAILFLDKELNIRRFSERVTGIIKLRNTDIGRFFTDIVSDLQYPGIEDHAWKVIKTLVPDEAAITTTDGRWYRVRIMPYRTLDDRIDGVVITFTDITALKILEIELKNANESYRTNK